MRLTAILGRQQQLWGVDLFDENKVPRPVRDRLQAEISSQVETLLLSLTPEQQRELIKNPSRRIEYLNKLMFQLMPTAILVGNSNSSESQFHKDIAEAIQETYLNSTESEQLAIQEILNKTDDPNFLPEVLKLISEENNPEDRFAPISEGSVEEFYNTDTFEQDFTEILKNSTGETLLDDLTNIGLEKQNIDSALKSLAELGYPPDLIYDSINNKVGLSENKFRLIFGNNVPYTPEFAKHLRDYSLIYNINNANKYNTSNLQLQDTATIRETSDKDFKKKHLNKINGVRTVYSKKETSDDQQPGGVQRINKTNKEIWDSLNKEEKLSILKVNGLINRSEESVTQEQEVTLSYQVTITSIIELSVAQGDPGSIPQQLFYGGQEGGMGGDEGQALEYDSPGYYASHPATSLGGVVKDRAGRYFKGKVKDKVKKEALKRGGQFAAKKLGTKAAASLAGAAASGGTSLLLTAGAELATNKKLQKALIIGGLTVPPALLAVISQVGTVGGAAMGAMIGTMLGIGPVFGAMAGGALGNLGAGGNLFGLKSLFGGGSGGGSAASSFLGDAGKAASQGTANATAALKRFSSGTQASSASTATSAAAVKSTFATTTASITSASTATIAVTSTIGIVAVASFFGFMTVQNALLADFSHVVPLGTSDSEGKTSRFVTVKKEVYIPGCPDQQCDDGNFPFEAEYTITITPKEDFVITIEDINDIMKVNHNEEYYEEIGERVPKLSSEEESTLSRDIVTLGSDISEGQVLNPGEEIVVKYRHNFSENYNHASVRNTVTLDFTYENDEESGSDDAITGDFICIGECPAGLGCWPTSGTIKSVPFSGIKTHLHSDSFDIANSVVGTPVFAPFDGRLCMPVKCSDKEYGCYVTLSNMTGLDPDDVLLMAHFEEAPLEVGEAGCKDVVAGTYIAPMGNRGNSSGPHVHYELKSNHNNPPSILSEYVPDGNDIEIEDPVRSCYDQ